MRIFFFGILILGFFGVFSLKRHKDFYEIPTGFRGFIEIIKEEKCGQQIERNKGIAFVKIPDDGILIIQGNDLNIPFDLIIEGRRNKYASNIFYEIGQNAERVEYIELQQDLFESSTGTNYSKDQVGVFYVGFGIGMIDGHDDYSFSQLFIGSYNQLKSNHYGAKSYLLDKQVMLKLQKCRGI